MKVLLAVDGSEHSINAAKEAVEYGVSMNAEVTALNVIKKEDAQLTSVSGWSKSDISALEQVAESMSKHANRVLEETGKLFEEKGMPLTKKVLTGDPGDIICKYASEGNFDLIIIGNRGLSGLRGMLGSVSSNVVHCTDKKVLIVK